MKIVCSNCGTGYDLTASDVGRRMRCDACNAELDLDAARAAPAEASPAAPPGPGPAPKGAAPGPLRTGSDAVPSPRQGQVPPTLGIWKDPLHRAPTPYEVLGVSRGADQATIERAVVAAIRRRVPPHEAQVARRALLSRVERASFDVRMYDPTVLERLLPSPLQDPGVLHPSRRLATAEAWERQLRSSFPDAGIEHSLGVLWYWWAQHEQERLDALLAAAPAVAREGTCSKPQLIHAAKEREGHACHGRATDCSDAQCAWREDCAARTPILEEIWQRVIVYWSMLSSTPEVWNGRLGLSEAEAALLRENFLKELGNQLVDQAQCYSQQFAPQHVLASCYRQLELCLASELKSAVAMAKSGYRTKRGRVTAGVLMLQHLGLLDKVRDQVDQLLQRTPGNKDLRYLQTLLSVYYPIIILLDEDKPDQALAQIELLPVQDQQSQRVRRLQARALLLSGRKQASVKEWEKALDSWKRALGAGGGDELIAEVRKEVVTTCQSQGHELEKREPERASRILERGLSLTDDPKLKLQLAELLVQRGIDTFNKAQEEIKGARGDALVSLLSTLEQARDDIARAAELGCKRGVENVKTAEDILAGFKQQMSDGLLDLPEKARSLWEDANTAIQRHDWDTAIAKLREALSVAGGNRLGLTTRLASALANRGIGLANQAVEKMSEATKSHDAQIAALTQKIERHFGNDECAICEKSKYSAYGENWYTVTLSGGKSAQLCRGCMQQLQNLQEHRPRPDRQSVALLQSAEADLAEAASLDPSSAHIQKNLRQVRETLESLPAECRPSKPVAPPAPAPRPPVTAAPSQQPPQQAVRAPAAPVSSENSDAGPKGTKFLKKTWWLWCLAGTLVWLLATKGCQ